MLDSPRMFMPIAARRSSIHAGVNETEAVPGNLKVQISDADGKIVFTKAAEADLGSGIAHLFSEQLDTKAASRGLYDQSRGYR